MSINKYFLISCFALTMLGCSDSKDEPVVPPIDPDKPTTTDKVVTFTTDVFTRSVITELGESAEMNVYAKEYNTLGAQSITDEKYKSICKNKEWSITPQIKLKDGEKAFLYTVYPYSANHIDPTAIPVDASKQIDYLYSGNGKMASYSEPKIALTMSHALAVMAFNVRKSSYSGEGVLQSIRIQGDKFVTVGKLNIEKGTISDTKVGELELKYSTKIEENGWLDNLPQTFTLPNESDGANVQVLFKIDGKEYMVVLPVIKIESGNKYIFRLGLTDSGLILFDDATETISLKTETDKMPVEGGANTVMFKFIGKSITLPQFTGKSMTSGLVDWGDNTPNSIYYSGLNHTYAESTEHIISVENWNAEEITFLNVKGIEHVDLCSF